MKTVAFVPAKGSSQRVPNKNTRTFNGEPFFVFTIRKLLRCDFIDEVYLDSESDEILEIGRRIGARPIKRDPRLADNSTDGHELFYNEVRQVEADIYLQHLCTSPFVSEATIRRIVDLLTSDSNLDSVALGKTEKVYPWSEGRPAYGEGRIPNSVDLPPQITEAMAIYAVKSDAAHRLRRRIGDRCRLIYGEPIELIDVNTEEDFRLATIVGAGMVAKEEKRLRLLARFLSSPVLSDVCDEMGLDAVVECGFQCNLSSPKIFGRARTLHIREATEQDPVDSIYKALESYQHVISNDILVVQNDLQEFAYFGELNMSLAIRSGAVGAIVGGVTRDNAATRRAGFPVFSRGSHCRDIKGRGAVASINMPILLGGIRVQSNDLVFADEDGIVVIPSEREMEVLERAVAKLATENQIVADVCREFDANDLVRKHGYF